MGSARTVPVALLLVTALSVLTLESASASGDGDAGAAKPPIRLKELYVPFEHFHALTAAHPDGVVMDLERYRELVREAARSVAAEELVPALPPHDAVITTALYSGTVTDVRGRRERPAARFTANLRIRVAGEGWVRCDLGAPLPALGGVQVDGAPGWLVSDRRSKRSRSHLLLRGQGEHEVVLTFTAPVVVRGEWSTLRGRGVPAAAAALALTVPGRAQGETRSRSQSLETDEREDATVFRLGLGSHADFELKWRSRKGEGENAALLTALHRISYRPRPAQPLFTWDAVVTVARRKTDSLHFREPPGATVLQVEGPYVHTWERQGDGLHVLLKEEVEGIVTLRLTGLF